MRLRTFVYAKMHTSPTARAGKYLEVQNNRFPNNPQATTAISNFRAWDTTKPTIWEDLLRLLGWPYIVWNPTISYNYTRFWVGVQRGKRKVVDILSIPANGYTPVGHSNRLHQWENWWWYQWQSLITVPALTYLMTISWEHSPNVFTCLKILKPESSSSVDHHSSGKLPHFWAQPAIPGPRFSPFLWSEAP